MKVSFKEMLKIMRETLRVLILKIIDTTVTAFLGMRNVMLKNVCYRVAQIIT